MSKHDYHYPFTEESALKEQALKMSDKERLLRFGKTVAQLSVTALLAVSLSLASAPEQLGTEPDTPLYVAPPVAPLEPILTGVEPEAQKYPNQLFASKSSWSQDFTEMKGNNLNPKTWNILNMPSPFNNEAEYFTDNTSNLRIENGALILQANKETLDNNNYTSARIDTGGRENFQYGKFEISAKLPAGVGTWPAIWMVPSNNIYAGEPIPKGSNSEYLNGEIDIAEAIGSYPGEVYGIGHSLKNPNPNQYPGVYYATTHVPDYNSAFHTYGVDWTPTNLSFTIDGNVFYSVDKQASYNYEQWPYDQSYNLVIDLALGGTWAGREKAAFPPDGIDQSVLPAQLAIQSINYFPYIDSSAPKVDITKKIDPQIK